MIILWIIFGTGNNTEKFYQFKESEFKYPIFNHNYLGNPNNYAYPIEWDSLTYPYSVGVSIRNSDPTTEWWLQTTTRKIDGLYPESITDKYATFYKSPNYYKQKDLPIDLKNLWAYTIPYYPYG